MGNPLPQIVHVEGRPRLLVDGCPFLILGLQWDCDSCFSAEEMNPLFVHAVRLGANTAALPLYWREIEPAPDQCDFTMLDERIRQAQAHGLRLVLLWFATWKNACSFYAPDYIKEDPVHYPLAQDRMGRPLVSLCPLGDATWERDRKALAAVMAHLRSHDPTRRVILFQIENEAGILGSDRCYCPTCTARFNAEGWGVRHGVDAAEAFSAASVTGYIDRLAAVAQAIYPIPRYLNVWLAGPVGAIPGHYPSGGAVPQVFDLARGHAPHVDLIAPDIYVHSYRDFHRICTIYRRHDNPLYVAEHSSGISGRAERNVFYAIGDHAALGFDPWAIDSPHPDQYDPPLVDGISGEWGPQAHALRDSYAAIGRAIAPIVAAQGTGRLFTFVQEPGESSAGWAADGCDLQITYTDRQGAGRGMAIQQGPDEFILLGTGFSATFRRPRPDGRPRPVARADWGRFDDDKWVLLHPMRRERLEAEGAPIRFQEPGVARVHLVPDA